MDEPKVSVVIPTKGRPQLACRALYSVLAQTFKNYEIIVVIDGKDHGTENSIREIDSLKIKVVINDFSVGGSEARNIGVRHSSGKWVAFLDDDDEWLPTKLERQLIKAESSNHEFPIIYCRLIGRSPYGDNVWPRRAMYENEHISQYLFVRSSLSQGEGLMQTTMLFASKDLLVHVPFQKGLRRHQEWDWLLRVASIPDVGFEFCEEILAIWYVEECRESISNQGEWIYSANWIKRSRPFVHRRAYSAFLMSVVSSIAKQQKDRKAFLLILRECIKHGRPKIIDYVIFLFIWLFPQDLRRSMRSLLLFRR